MKRATDPDVRLLQAIADATRLAIVRQLAAVEEVCACDFTSCCDVAQPTVSHHLKVLREAGWVRAERRGSWVWYSLEPAAAERLRLITASLTERSRSGAAIAARAGPASPRGARELPVLG